MKKLINYLIAFTFLFSISLNVNASPVTKDRNSLDNYGVNKKWNINSSNLSNVLNTPCVNSAEKIYDFSDVLDDTTEKELFKKIQTFILENKVDLVIVTVNLPYTYDKKNEDYASDFYDYNDFGINFDNYSGILLLRNTYAADPYYDMYTFGDAQLYFDQNRYDNILDGIYNDLHVGNYLEGFSDFIDRVSYYYRIGKPSSMDGYKVDDYGYLYKEDSSGHRLYYDEYDSKWYYYDENGKKILYQEPFLAVVSYPTGFILASIITLIVMLVLIGKNKMVKRATTASEYINPGSINFSVRNDQFITSHTSSYTVSSSSGGGSSGGGGHSSHSGSSGGGHSSGGGRHG